MKNGCFVFFHSLRYFLSFRLDHHLGCFFPSLPLLNQLFCFWSKLSTLVVSQDLGPVSSWVLGQCNWWFCFGFEIIEWSCLVKKKPLIRIGWSYERFPNLHLCLWCRVSRERIIRTGHQLIRPFLSLYPPQN